MTRRFLVFLAAVFLLFPVGAGAQASAPPAALTPPEPYSEDEFEPWMLDLRRAEIIAIGAFPVAYLFAGLGYDYYYYLSQGFPVDNIPWPAGPGTSRWVVTTDKERLNQKNAALIGTSVAAGLILAAVDWWLGQ